MDIKNNLFSAAAVFEDFLQLIKQGLLCDLVITFIIFATVIFSRDITLKPPHVSMV